MKLLFILIFLSGCVTCPSDDIVTDVMVETMSQEMGCGGYSQLRQDIYEIVDDLDTCKVDRTDPETPKGNWTGASLGCYMAALEIHTKTTIGEIPESWGCHTYPMDAPTYYKRCLAL